jgi:biotin transport system substrate-specific component
MTAANLSIHSRAVLADFVPARVFAGSFARDAVLVAAGTGLVAAASQVTIPLGFTPVPLSLATFAVLLTGASLGPVRATISMLLFAGLGVAGVPWFAHHGHGWDFVTFGYVIGYVLAAPIIGMLARRGVDRSLPGTFLLSALASLVIYACGVPWLAHYAHIDLATALRLGARPFLIGDAVKAAAAAALLPATWKIVAGKR